VELAIAHGAAKPGGLTMAAISAVFTIGYVANLLGENEDWLHDLSIDMFPEDGCLRVYGIGEDGVTAFTEYGIECLQQMEWQSGWKPPSGPARPANLGLGGHRVRIAHPKLVKPLSRSLPLGQSPHRGAIKNHPADRESECHQGNPGRFVETVGHLGVSANLIEAPPWGWTAFPPKYSTKYVVTARA
jgi:hypothetical protein